MLFQIHSTGYVQVASTRPEYGTQFGYDILPDPGITALFHNHFFVFKADLDIGEQKSNRFMVCSIAAEHSWIIYISVDVTSDFSLLELGRASHFNCTTNYQYHDYY